MANTKYLDKTKKRIIELYEELPAENQEQVLDEIKYSNVLGLVEEIKKTGTVLFGDLYPEVMDRQKFFNKFEGFRSGLTYFDNATMGFRPGELIIVAGPSNLGKQQRVSEIIPTPLGDKRFGDLGVGDKVFGSDGHPTTVSAIYPQGIQPIYRVNFTDGSYLDTGENHLWTLRRMGRPDRVVTTGDMLQKLPSSKYHIPLTAPLEYGDDSEPVPAYELGMYLADGSMCGNSVHITKSSGKVSDYLRSIDNELARYDHPRTCGYLYGNSKSKLSKYIRTSGLAQCKSDTKFIPNEWFNKSVSVRKKLLFGLMDGDGRVGIGMDKVPMYSTISAQLADDVVRLVTSLGYMARKSYVPHHIRGWYTIRLVGIDYNPFMHKGQKDRFQGCLRRKYRGIQSVEIVGAEEAMCISVDASDQLYVGDTRFNVVTHNTMVSLNIVASAIVHSHKKILVISMEMTALEIASRIYNMADVADHEPLMENLIIQTELSVSAKHIAIMIERLKPDMVVVDHIQFLANQEVGQEYERMNAAVSKLKQVAMTQHLPVIAISHVAKTRSGLKGQATASDLKGTSSIEQDCDIGFMLNRKEEEDEITITCFKHRTKRPSVFLKDCYLTFDGVRIANGGRYTLADGSEAIPTKEEPIDLPLFGALEEEPIDPFAN